MNQAQNNRLNLLVLIASMLLGGFTALCLGKELNWDLANYHYYNPFAYLHQRWQQDVWPMEHVHVFLTPTLDFIAYFFINHFPPILTVFVMGALHGINFWLLFCIARFMLSFLPSSKHELIIALAVTFLGFYGPLVIPGIGSFQQDLTVSLFVLVAIYLQLQALCLLDPSKSNRSHHFFMQSSSWIQFAAGIVLGVGIGLKLTAAVFLVGSAAAWMLSALSYRRRFVMIGLFVLGVALGVLLSSGYWMWFLWSNHHNPFYPFWNAVFKSPSFPAINWGDHRFHPQGWLQQWFFPFYFSWELQTLDAPFRDVRYLVLYVVFVLFALKWVWQFITRSARQTVPTGVKWMFVFFISTYIVWQTYFSILRYVVTLEMLAPLTIYLVLVYLLTNHRLRIIMASLLFFFMTFCMMTAPMVRMPWYQADYFHVQMPAHIENTKEAIVLMPISAYAFGTWPRPQFYLIPFFPPKWRFVGIPFSGKTYAVPANVANLLKQPLSQPVFALASPEYMSIMRRIARQAGMKPAGACAAISSDRQIVTNEDVLLCRLK